MALFYLCKVRGCNKKYKTSNGLIDHMLLIHEEIMDQVVEPVDISGGNKKKVENERNNLWVKDKMETARQNVIAKQAAKEAVEKAYMAEESERYRDAQERALKIQEEQLHLEQRMLESSVVAENAAFDFEAKCRSNASKSSDICCICFEDPRDTAPIPCGHRFFCGPCIKTYLEKSAKKQCPICRREVIMECEIYM